MSMAKMDEAILEVAGREVVITPGKVFSPQTGYTKRDLAAYYVAAAAQAKWGSSLPPTSPRAAWTSSASPRSSTNDVPHDADSSVHRIGRTGRAGRTGTAILFVTARETRLLQFIERVTGQKVATMRMPSAATSPRDAPPSRTSAAWSLGRTASSHTSRSWKSWPGAA
jgi:hypothetical protein